MDSSQAVQCSCNPPCTATINCKKDDASFWFYSCPKWRDPQQKCKFFQRYPGIPDEQEQSLIGPGSAYAQGFFAHLSDRQRGGGQRNTGYQKNNAAPYAKLGKVTPTGSHASTYNPSTRDLTIQANRPSTAAAPITNPPTNEQRLEIHSAQLGRIEQKVNTLQKQMEQISQSTQETLALVKGLLDQAKWPASPDTEINEDADMGTVDEWTEKVTK